MVLDCVGQQSPLVALGNQWATATEQSREAETCAGGTDHIPKPESGSQGILRSTLIGFDEFWHFQHVPMCPSSVLDTKAVGCVSSLLKSLSGR